MFVWISLYLSGKFDTQCFSLVWQVASVSARLCDQTMELQEEKVTPLLIGWLTRFDFLTAGKWLGETDEGGHVHSFIRGFKVFVFVGVGVCVCMWAAVWGVHRGQLPIKRMGQGKHRQETGSWKRKLRPLSPHNTVAIATASSREGEWCLAQNPFKAKMWIV